MKEARSVKRHLDINAESRNLTVLTTSGHKITTTKRKIPYTRVGSKRSKVHDDTPLLVVFDLPMKREINNNGFDNKRVDKDKGQNHTRQRHERGWKELR